MMYQISESELTFLLDLFQESLNTEEVPSEEFEEGVDLIEAILSNPQIEAVA